MALSFVVASILAFTLFSNPGTVVFDDEAPWRTTLPPSNDPPGNPPQELRDMFTGHPKKHVKFGLWVIDPNQFHDYGEKTLDQNAAGNGFQVVNLNTNYITMSKGPAPSGDCCRQILYGKLDSETTVFFFMFHVKYYEYDGPAWSLLDQRQVYYGFSDPTTAIGSDPEFAIYAAPGGQDYVVIDTYALTPSSPTLVSSATITCDEDNCP
jgi:hypothetical protein